MWSMYVGIVQTLEHAETEGTAAAGPNDFGMSG